MWRHNVIGQFSRVVHPSPAPSRGKQLMMFIYRVISPFSSFVSFTCFSSSPFLTFSKNLKYVNTEFKLCGEKLTEVFYQKKLKMFRIWIVSILFAAMFTQSSQKYRSLRCCLVMCQFIKNFKSQGGGTSKKRSGPLMFFSNYHAFVRGVHVHPACVSP